MKNFFPLIIILIVSSTICSSTEEKTKQNENSSILSSLINGATNFYSNYLETTVKYVTCPLGDKGCQIAANIQIASEGLKNAGLGQEAGAKLLEKVIDISSTNVATEMTKKAGEKVLEKVIDKTSTEAIKEVVEKKAEKVVYEWGTKTSFSFFKVVPVLSSGYSLYNAYKKIKNDDKVGATLYVAEAAVNWIPGISYLSLIPSALNTIKEVSEMKKDK